MTFLNRLGVFWRDRKYHLDRMTLPELWIAYFQYAAIQAYILLLILSLFFLRRWGAPQDGWMLGLIVGIVFLVYPLVWYLLHRFMLHGRFLYRFPQTAALWKRIHYDHHQDPNDLRVLFGSLLNTLPTIALICLPIGALLGGKSGAMAAFAAGLAMTLFYEFCHCIQHLRYTPKNHLLRYIKRLHLMHHFHNEKGNYGITNFFWDRLLGTCYERNHEIACSETVSNLGYTDQERRRYPWVAELPNEAPEIISPAHPPLGK